MRLRANRNWEMGNRQSPGVTLMEVVIAIFVLTVGVLSIIALFPAGYRLSQQAFDRTIGALAARDARARIMAEAKRGGFSFPPYTQTLGTVAEAQRVGSVSRVYSSQLECRVRGDEVPTWSVSLSNYYLVITSGTAAGGVYRITGTGGGRVTCSGVTFRTSTSTTGEPVRVGDHFAIIGSTSGTRCYPSNFLSSSGSGRTIPIATEGETKSRADWTYSYGCIISADVNPSTEGARHLHRVDVFVYQNFDDSKPVEQQPNRPVAHYVTYIPHLDDYDNP